MLRARQSAAVDSMVASEQNSGHRTDTVTQMPVWDESVAVDALLERRKYASESFSTDRALEEVAPNDDSTGRPQVTEEFDSILALPPQPQYAPAATFHALQEWEGYVLSIGKEAFEARLLDMTARATHEGEEATIPLSEISDHDIRKLRAGAIFRWVIGYERTTGGTRRRVSQIVFRNLPTVTKSDRQAGEEWARDMFQSLNP